MTLIKHLNSLGYIIQTGIEHIDSGFLLLDVKRAGDRN
jgi:hypothetical protein